MGKLLGSSTKPQGEEGNNKANSSTVALTLNNAKIPQDNNSQQGNSSNNNLSASLVTSVNIAAETARLVLQDQSHLPSQLLDNVQNSQRDSNNYWGGESQPSSKTVTFSSPTLNKPGSFLSGIQKLDVSIRSELTENSIDDQGTDGTATNTNTTTAEEEESNNNNIIASTPPPLVFQNLPMSRYIPTSSHGDHDRKVLGSYSSSLSSRPIHNIEVTNHFDAAAAISAALASSNYAQASSSSSNLGELQKKAMGFKRDESFTDDSVENNHIVLTPSNYMVENKDVKTKNGPDATAAKLRSLPSQEEAVREMRERRSSYETLNDDSITEFLTNAYAQRTAGGESVGDDGKPHVSEEKKVGVGLHDDFLNQHHNRIESDLAKSDLLLPKVDDAAASRRKSNQTEGGDSISICSSNDSGNGRSSNFENESNTSSYGSSDFSPITMSFGSSSDDGKQDRGNTNDAGVLGSLAKLSPPLAELQGDASYGPGTDEEDNRHNGENNRNEGVTTAVGPRLLADGSKLSMHLAPSRSASKIDKPTVERSTAALPINPQYVPLFESFDRNLAQSLEGNPDNEKILEMSKHFISSFVAVLGAIEDKKNKEAKAQSNNDASDVDTGLSHYDWWSENAKEVLGYNLGVVNDEKSDDDQQAKLDKAEHQAELTTFGFPTIVVRSMWASCFFGGDVDEDEVEKTLDFIQDNLVNNLHYIAETQEPSIPCLCLALPLYKEYAWYTLCRHAETGSVDRIVALWNSKFAAFLREALLLTDKDGPGCESNV